MKVIGIYFLNSYGFNITKITFKTLNWLDFYYKITYFSWNKYEITIHLWAWNCYSFLQLAGNQSGRPRQHHLVVPGPTHCTMRVWYVVDEAAATLLTHQDEGRQVFQKLLAVLLVHRSRRDSRVLYRSCACHGHLSNEKPAIGGGPYIGVTFLDFRTGFACFKKF